MKRCCCDRSQCRTAAGSCPPNWSDWMIRLNRRNLRMTKKITGLLSSTFRYYHRIFTFILSVRRTCCIGFPQCNISQWHNRATFRGQNDGRLGSVAPGWDRWSLAGPRGRHQVPMRRQRMQLGIVRAHLLRQGHQFPHRIRLIRTCHGKQHSVSFRPEILHVMLMSICLCDDYLGSIHC